MAALQAAVRPCPLLPEHGAGWFGRPGLSGHRLDTSGGHPAAGRDWSPRLRAARTGHECDPGRPAPRRAGLASDLIPGAEATGGALAGIGLAIPAQRALTALVVLVEAL